MQWRSKWKHVCNNNQFAFLKYDLLPVIALIELDRVIPTPRESVVRDHSRPHRPFRFSWAEMVGRSRSAAELRVLWRKAIMEQILLIRMEKENTSLEGMSLNDDGWTTAMLKNNDLIG